MKKIPIIIDCDPGVDDVLAIMLAHTKEELEIKAITTVSGNVTLNYTTHNARLAAGLIGLQVPIAAGADQPIVKKRVTASKVHGEDGFGGYASLFPQEQLAPLSTLSARELLYKTLMESEEPITIVAIGPLTNIAILLLAHPEVKEKIAHICFMGGGMTVGNVTPTAEFNFYVDPEAAQIVFNSGIKLTMIGLDVTTQADIRKEDILRFEKIEGEIAQIGTKILDSYASVDAALHDPVAILALTNPELLQGEDLFVQVETNEGSTRALTYADRRHGRHPQENCHVIWKIDRAKFLDEMEQALRYYATY